MKTSFHTQKSPRLSAMLSWGVPLLFGIPAPSALAADFTVRGAFDTASAARPGPAQVAVVVFFGRGEQIFDVGPLPQLGKGASSRRSSAHRKGAGARRDPRHKNAASPAGGRPNPGWLKGYRAGFRCKVLLLFWAYVHRWSCKPVVFRGQTYLRSSTSDRGRARWISHLEAAIAKRYSLSDHELSWWAQNGRLVLGGILVLLMIGGVLKRMRSRRY